jgi:hypothetical protein
MCSDRRQCRDVLTADQTTDLEDTDTDKEYQLEVEVLVGFAPGRLRRGNSQEEGAAVPANILKTAKLGLRSKSFKSAGCQKHHVDYILAHSYSRDRSRDNRLLLSLSAASDVVRCADLTMSSEH